MKTTTIPKLELCSVLLLSKLIASTREKLQIDLSNVFAWSDSTISLSWIHTSPHQLKTYVVNRVVAIINHVPAQHWRHVPSADNPADLGSRGCTASTLTESKLWWTGPPWLKQGPDNWPLQERQEASVSELKDSALIMQPPLEELLNLSERYSSYVKIINVLSWLLRFVDNTRKEKSDRILDAILTVTELENAEVRLYKMHQSCLMRTELTSLTAGKPVPKSSPLQKLNPLLDKNGVIRVGGRLTQSELPYGQRHPVVIHHKSPLARLLILHLHRKHMHAGPTALMAILSRNHYIIGSCRLVREITGHCTKCCRAYARTSTQLMGELPQARSSPAPTFSQVGVDFAGPISLKLGHTRKPVIVKAYIGLFVCLVTKAVHIELVSDLSTDAFLAAFRLFVAQRGYPTDVHSDNGTNFIGAKRELVDLYTLLRRKDSQESLCQYFSQNHVRWHFIPGLAPHFGGLWEAAVKSAKILLRKILGTQTLTVEEYDLVLSDVEATLNSRLLCVLNSLPEDGMEVLTPGHFLIGRPLTAPPQRPVEELQLSARKRWNLCQKLHHEFWHRWQQEYLHTLQKRNKWSDPQHNLRIGDVVLIKDQDLFVRTWPLALVTDIHPGADGRVRAVTLKTSKGYYTRLSVKVVLLLENKEDTSLVDNYRSLRGGGGCSGRLDIYLNS